MQIRAIIKVNHFILFTLGSLLMNSSVVLAAGFSSLSQGSFVPGEVLVKFKRGISDFTQTAVLNRKGGVKLRDLNLDGLAQVLLIQGQDVNQAVIELNQNPDVEYAQPNFIYRTLTTPNDPHYGQLWGLKNTGQTVSSSGLGGPNSVSATNNPGTSGNDMGLEAAWGLITDCSSVVVAVVDTGVNYNHADLSANMWDGGSSYPNHGYDYVDNTNDPMDQAGHGTHVAGTIGAVGNNSVGSTGVCWKVQIMAVRALDATGSGTTSTLAQAIYFAVTNGAKVINLSVGGSGFDSTLNAAVTNAQTHGVVVVAAAGNDGTNNDSVSTPVYPCNFTQDNLICVAALDQKFLLTSFSNYGATSVDVGAPGINIVSAWPGTTTTQSDALLSSSGWTTSTTTANGWGYENLSFGGSSTACLVNPPLYDHSTHNYDNSTDGRIYKAFNLSGANVALLDFWAIYDMEAGHDYLRIAYSGGGGDPFSSGTVVASLTGTTSASRQEYIYDISSCITSTCSVGFRITSDSSSNSYGAGISLFAIKTLTLNPVTYNVLAGTSMATPHVAGLAAMLFAYNSSYGYQDVVASIQNGGTALGGLAAKTSSGKAVNAMGSLAYINTPSGVTAVKQ